jgi:hypothetical protein
VIQWSALIHEWYISGDGDERARYGGGRDWCVRRTSLKRIARKILDLLDRRDGRQGLRA